MHGNYLLNEFVKIPLLKLKYITYSKDINLARQVNSPTLIPVACLHFQGSAKKFINLFSKFKAINLTSGLAYRLLKWCDQKPLLWNLLYFFHSKLAHLKFKFQKLNTPFDDIIAPEIKLDEFFENLSHFAKIPQIKTFLEIGSSSGGGSTQAFVDTLRNRLDKNEVSFYCMELSKARFDVLYQTYKNDLFVKAYNLSSISLSEFPTQQDIIKFYFNINSKLNNTKLNTILKWYRNDIAYIKNSNCDVSGIDLIKAKENIQFFDMVLIDGSEFTGEVELDKIIGAKIIALDDTETYKCYIAMQKLQLDENYQLIIHRPEIRNGYAIFARKDCNIKI
jgi:hypothetical protein